MKRKKAFTKPALILNPLSEFTFHRSGRYLVAFGEIIPPPSSSVCHPDQQSEVDVHGGLWEAHYDAKDPCSIRLVSKPNKLIPIVNITAWAFLGFKEQS